MTKDEIKDEIKNRISMALKDPVLQQGFEIICKNLIELEQELENERKLNAEIKARFVKCNTCTPDMKEKCLMFNENLCEGERCEELVDLMSLVEKCDLNNVLSLWQQAICEIRGEIKAQETPALVYAKELCDKLESSMVAYAKGDMLNVRFNIE